MEWRERKNELRNERASTTDTQETSLPLPGAMHAFVHGCSRLLSALLSSTSSIWGASFICLDAFVCRQVSTYPDAVGDRAGQGRAVVQPSRPGCKPRKKCMHSTYTYSTVWLSLDKGGRIPCACALGWVVLVLLGSHRLSSRHPSVHMCVRSTG